MNKFLHPILYVLLGVACTMTVDSWTYHEQCVVPREEVRTAYDELVKEWIKQEQAIQSVRHDLGEYKKLVSSLKEQVMERNRMLRELNPELHARQEVVAR